MSYQLWFSDLEDVTDRIRYIASALADGQLCVDEKEGKIVLVYYFHNDIDAEIVANFLNKLLSEYLGSVIEKIVPADTRVDIYLKTI